MKVLLAIGDNLDDVEGWNVTLVKKFERDYRIHMKQSLFYLYEVE